MSPGDKQTESDQNHQRAEAPPIAQGALAVGAVWPCGGGGDAKTG